MTHSPDNRSIHAISPLSIHTIHTVWLTLRLAICVHRQVESVVDTNGAGDTFATTFMLVLSGLVGHRWVCRYEGVEVCGLLQMCD